MAGCGCSIIFGLRGGENFAFKFLKKAPIAFKIFTIDANAWSKPVFRATITETKNMETKTKKAPGAVTVDLAKTQSASPKTPEELEENGAINPKAVKMAAMLPNITLIFANLILTESSIRPAKTEYIGTNATPNPNR